MASHSSLEDRAHERLRRLAAHLHASTFCSPLADCGGVSPLSPVETCGIVAYIGPAPGEEAIQDAEDASGDAAASSSSATSSDAAAFVLRGLTILQNRGYDSAGLSSVTADRRLITTKFASSAGHTADAIERLRSCASRHRGHHLAIGHTRWATHGGVCDRNAHPHTDTDDRIALVHNGVIENASELREQLLRDSTVKLSSETDSELIAQMLGLELRAGKDLLNALYAVLPQLRGTWGLALVDRECPERLLATANGSPLLVGIGRGEMYLASEASAFGGRTKDYIELRDGEIVVLTKDGHSLDDSRVETAEQEEVQLSPEPWPHWTLKEIFEQPEAISRSLNHGGRLLSRDTVMLGGMEQHRETLSTVRHLVICACGTSYYAGLFGARLMRSLRAFDTVQVFDAAEFSAEDLPREHGGMLVISQSGETKDVHRALLIAQEHDLPTFSVVNVVRSMIARFTGCGVYLNAGREHAVASTKAFTCQVSVLAQLAIWFAQVHQVEQQRRETLVNALHRVATSLGMVLQRLRPACKQLAVQLRDTRHLFVLGKGLAEPVAREGALKIKEITYLHAEGYPGGSLKHGPFALLEPGLPMFLVILADRHEHFMWTTLEEVRARGAFTIVITDCAVKGHEQHIDCLLRIPTNGPLTSLLAVVPLQLFAYELSVLRGHNPDFPRNLAKTVTTD